MHRKQFFFTAALAVVLLSTPYLALAQGSASQPSQQGALPHSPNSDDAQPQIDGDIKLLRKDLRSQKKQIVAANMDLTDAVAEKFWPVYDQYTADLEKIHDTKVALINQYWQTFNTMSGAEAEDYIRKRAGVEESIIGLRVKYIPIFGKVLSGRQTALFFQIDWRVDLLVNLQLAQMPLIDP